MDIHELIVLTQECLGEAICAERKDNLSSAYTYLNRLYDLLTKELVPMEKPEGKHRHLIMELRKIEAREQQEVAKLLLDEAGVASDDANQAYSMADGGATKEVDYNKN